MTINFPASTKTMRYRSSSINAFVCLSLIAPPLYYSDHRPVVKTVSFQISSEEVQEQPSQYSLLQFSLLEQLI